MRRSRRGLLTSLLVSLAVSGCAPVDPVEGVFRCDTDADCPSRWHCEARGAEADKLCWQPVDTMFDAGLDPFAQTPTRSGGQAFRDVDAASLYPCGSWTRISGPTALVPENATPYGFTWVELGGTVQRGYHYVCRFQETRNGQVATFQGKGAFGFGCFGADFTPPARVVSSSDFDVLVETEKCAGMVPFNTQVRMMPTGVDRRGQATFSCVAQRASLEYPDQTNRVLGRFDPEAHACLFEWDNKPTAQMEDFLVLSAP